MSCYTFIVGGGSEEKRLTQETDAIHFNWPSALFLLLLSLVTTKYDAWIINISQSLPTWMRNSLLVYGGNLLVKKCEHVFKLFLC